MGEAQQPRFGASLSTQFALQWFHRRLAGPRITDVRPVVGGRGPGVVGAEVPICLILIAAAFSESAPAAVGVIVVGVVVGLA